MRYLMSILNTFPCLTEDTFPMTKTNAPKPTSRRWRIGVAAGAAILLLAGGIYISQAGMGRAQMPGHGRHHGADGTGHDMINMPGLKGLDATLEESAELATMFRNFQKIERTVKNLPNGIQTVTYTKDEELRAIVVSHVTGMLQRVEEGRDPKVMIQSPTLDILFERRDKIKTGIKTTDDGIEVTQTSDDPEVVKALQTHAAEVTAMVDRGMDAVHEMMMKRGRPH